MPALEQKKTHIERFLQYLNSHREDRGMMADLRHGFSAATEYRAWPHLGPWCDLARDRDRHILRVIGGGFATHGNTAAGVGNLGTTLRRLALGDSRNEDGLRSFDGRFRRLLACAEAEEVCRLLPPLLRAAERRSIPVDYAQLWRDLHYWGERTRTSWAAGYWSGAQAAEGEAAGGEA